MTDSTLIAGILCHWRRTAILLGLILGTWLVFGQTLNHDFVSYDDSGYVYQNDLVSGGLTVAGLKAAFLQPHARNWHPLTTISHMVDCQLFGLDPRGHHLVSVLLHIAASLLLFEVLTRATAAPWRAAFVAGLFAIHPLRAESVAWIAERKDVLSAFFFMLALGAYIFYARQPSARRYLLAMLLLGFGLMAKPMLVTLPLLFLLLDYWPLGRFGKTASRRRKTAPCGSPASVGKNPDARARWRISNRDFAGAALHRWILRGASAVLAGRQQSLQPFHLYPPDVLADEPCTFLSLSGPPDFVVGLRPPACLAC